MDRRRIELQIRAILVTYRIEHGRRDAPTMDLFRERARLLFDELDEAVRSDPDLRRALADARRELDGDERSARSGLGKEAVDGGHQVVDAERLR